MIKDVCCFSNFFSRNLWKIVKLLHSFWSKLCTFFCPIENNQQHMRNYSCHACWHKAVDTCPRSRTRRCLHIFCSSSRYGSRSPKDTHIWSPWAQAGKYGSSLRFECGNHRGYKTDPRQNHPDIERDCRIFVFDLCTCPMSPNIWLGQMSSETWARDNSISRPSCLHNHPKSEKETSI